MQTILNLQTSHLQGAVKSDIRMAMLREVYLAGDGLRRAMAGYHSSPLGPVPSMPVQVRENTRRLNNQDCPLSPVHALIARPVGKGGTQPATEDTAGI